jgi:HAD superfamily hydrolase (TIGR01490 family)
MKLALFDLDHTLLPIDSDYSWGVYTTDIGWTDDDHFRRRNDEFYAHYKAGTLDIHEYVRFSTEATRLKGPQVAAQAHADFMATRIRPNITPQALDLIRSHEREQVIIVTATNEFITRPIATALGVSELIAIELERDASGWITGGIQGTPSFREGKVTRVKQWLDERHRTWDEVEMTFYSDSINDLALLEKATHPVATNPDPRLRTVAIERGWRILELFS